MAKVRRVQTGVIRWIINHHVFMIWDESGNAFITNTDRLTNGNI